MAREKGLRPNTRCPHCKDGILEVEDTRPGEVTAYCVMCGYRLTVTNTCLAAEIGNKDPVMALRMLVDGKQWENICIALGGKSVLIPGGKPAVAHRKCKPRIRAITYTQKQEDKIVMLKTLGKSHKEICRRVKLPMHTVNHVIYVKRRDDLKATRSTCKNRKLKGG